MFADVNSERTPEKINETISSMMGFFGSADRNRSGQPQPHRQRKLYTEQTS
jgi:hypothetical protein